MFEFSDETLHYFSLAKEHVGELDLKNPGVTLFSWGEPEDLIRWKLFIEKKNNAIVDYRFQASGGVCAIALIAFIAEQLKKEEIHLDFELFVQKLKLSKAQYGYALMAEKFINYIKERK